MLYISAGPGPWNLLGGGRGEANDRTGRTVGWWQATEKRTSPFPAGVDTICAHTHITIRYTPNRNDSTGPGTVLQSQMKNKKRSNQNCNKEDGLIQSKAQWWRLTFKLASRNGVITLLKRLITHTKTVKLKTTDQQKKKKKKRNENHSSRLLDYNCVQWGQLRSNSTRFLNDTLTPKQR